MNSNPNPNSDNCSLCDTWNDQVPPHRHAPGHWVFPSATTPGTIYTTRVIRQPIEDQPLPAVEGKPVGTSCTCPLGYQPTGSWCWHAGAAFAFELEEFAKHKPGHNPVRYEQACEGRLKQQAVILWFAARQAAREQNATRNRLFIRALHRIVESLNVQLPIGLELRIDCITCFGMDFPEMHLHHTDAPAPDFHDQDQEDPSEPGHPDNPHTSYTLLPPWQYPFWMQRKKRSCQPPPPSGPNFTIRRKG